MGCTQSKIENEESVTRCKERKRYMKEAVVARNAFAAAHSSYSMSLKNTGAALSDYASCEIPQSSSAVPGSAPSAAALPSSSLGASPPPPPPSSSDESLLPPPPLPTFATKPPLQRAVTMPEIKMQDSDGKPPAIMEEVPEEDAELDAHESEKLVRRRRSGRSVGGKGDQEAELPSRQQQQQRKPKRREEEVMRSQPQQTMQQDYMDYWFPPVDSIPGPSLSDPVDSVPEEARDEELTRRANAESEGNVSRETQNHVMEEMEKEASAAIDEEEEKPLEAPPPMPVPVATVEKKHMKKVGDSGGRRVGKTLNLMAMFTELDDHFLKASESAQEVSKMLEATRLHYHSNFADNRGHIDHSARVMRVITWNRSFKGIPNVDDAKDEFDNEEQETHATVLDKMLAWEKKLYDEVKAGEIMKYEYQKKVASLNRQKKRNPNSESLEKLKAAVSLLHTRYMVDMQAMDSTVAEINRLRDEQLYPKLVQLVGGMATVWETMQGHHETQVKIVSALRYLEISQSARETSEHHHERTFQLWVVVQEWHSHFCKLFDNQRAYIKALNNWIKLNLIPIESSLKEQVSSPVRIPSPPIQALVIAWNDDLEKLPDEGARSAINSFAAVVNSIFQHQEEELKMKEKCESTRKELTRKMRQFEEWYHKTVQKRTSEDLDPKAADNAYKDSIAERQMAVELLKQQLLEDEEAYQKQCLHVREKSLASLKTRLPELFRDMYNISFACANMYRNLRSITQRQNPN